ncbi:capsid assembly protein [Campylobacter hyointestinalis]|uniref:capsid assembly protein n=1 Tax=Campylobacter hyointestinalis TaxID=198 RepID=UPI00072B0D55|nr:hypothetical protein [Campylobacter hyointestinalis]PPB51705.1 hypothetical protein CDQ69_08875 [Campylobacter hyointestinalis subsp. hyointestinalis]PPB55980.1 hypothetical protein CDQ67_01715 [Campylobacter hyointestinalis subsp. hyointestinalis]PPB61445.1 hypothetical protein CDQ74_08675 [Campylobacter hyointestinalis subsp. hyointestinalis]CUU87634.1 Uncharacterised protein [Campylobacter hyointestinalis subsp. hyointestinalis]
MDENNNQIINPENVPSDGSQRVENISSSEGLSNSVPTNVPSTAKDIAEPADFNYSEYETEFLTTGDISPQSREKLYKQFPKNLVDNYIENMKGASEYRTTQAENKIYDVVGGQDKYKELVSWISENMSDDEINRYNAIVTGSDINLAMEYVKGIEARRAISNKRPNIIMGSSSTKAGNSDVFYSRKDYAMAIADEKYSTSPEYRAMLQAKLERTLKYGGFRE